MVRLVAECPREAVFPVLLQRCRSPPGGRYEKVSHLSTWWSIAIPVYLGLMNVGANVIFLVGSALFLPGIFEQREVSVSLSIAVQNLNKNKLLAGNRSFLDRFERNVTRAVASLAGGSVSEEETALQWRQTTTCSLEDTIIVDIAIRPFLDAAAFWAEGNLSGAAGNMTLGRTVNASIAALDDIEEVVTGPVNVRVIGEPHLSETAKSSKWAIDGGCYMFILGSALMALLSVYDVLEDVLNWVYTRSFGVCLSGANLSQNSTDDLDARLAPESESFGGKSDTSRSRSKRVTLRESGVSPSLGDEDLLFGTRTEKCLYFLGSVVFLVGTLYFQHPKVVSEKFTTVAEQDVLLWSIAMFIIGSVFFSFAAFFNALSISSSGRTFTNWAVFTCGVYELGAILFVMGSVCFLPNMGCGRSMEALGAWCFIVGSFFYILGALVEVVKTVALLFLQQKQQEAVYKIEHAVLAWLHRLRVSRKTEGVEERPPRRVSSETSLLSRSESSQQRLRARQRQDFYAVGERQRSSSWEPGSGVDTALWVDDDWRGGRSSERLPRAYVDTVSPRRGCGVWRSSRARGSGGPRLLQTFFQAMDEKAFLRRLRPSSNISAAFEDDCHGDGGL